MRIRTYGHHPLFSKKELRDTVRFMGNILFTPKLNENLLIKIAVVSDEKLDGYGADCAFIDSNLRPRQFKILLNETIGRRRTIEVLGHELVHVKQYATRDLKWTARFGPLKKEWRDGVVYEEVEGDPNTYNFLPWEIEARGYENALADAYLEHVKAL
jgi:hypothetical protein